MKGREERETYPSGRAAEAAGGERVHTDDIAVDAFAAAMKAKLARKRGEGRRGWEDCSPQRLWDMLREHVAKGDPVDVGNLAMMIWHQERKGRVKGMTTDPVQAALEVLTMHGVLRYGRVTSVAQHAMEEALEAAEHAETLARQCDEPGCAQPSSCGFPTETGYRRTCEDHYRPRPHPVVRTDQPGALPGDADNGT